ncbi:MAG: UDP-glucose 4-epimerase GalE [Holophaga sp.]
MAPGTSILVTGGAGYIGSHVVQRLVERGFDVTVLDNLCKGHREAVHPSANFVQGDCGDKEILGRIFTGRPFSAVLHFAAFIEAGESMRFPERFFANNTANTLRLLETMLEHGVDKFIFSSTAATYGAPLRTPMAEDHPQDPTNAYGLSKLLVEKALAWLHQLRGLRFAALRYFNAAGCSKRLGEDHAPETHLIPLLLDVALGKRDAVGLFGTDYPTPDGTCIRDYIHVEDLASAHLLALQALEGQPKLHYNLGTETGYSVRQVIETARTITGHAIPVREEPRREGDPPVLVASAARIRQELGWEPAHSDLASIIQSAWDWRRSHPDGYAAGQSPF